MPTVSISIDELPWEFQMAVDYLADVEPTGDMQLRGGEVRRVQINGPAVATLLARNPGTQTIFRYTHPALPAKALFALYGTVVPVVAAGTRAVTPPPVAGTGLIGLTYADIADGYAAHCTLEDWERMAPDPVPTG